MGAADTPGAPRILLVMSTQPSHQAESAAGAPSTSSDGQLTTQWLAETRADCCGARAMFRAVLPGEGSVRELYLCGHHLRAKYAALLDAGVAVFDLGVTVPQIAC